MGFYIISNRFSFQNGEQLFIGAVGSWYWQGKINYALGNLNTVQA